MPCPSSSSPCACCCIGSEKKAARRQQPRGGPVVESKRLDMLADVGGEGALKEGTEPSAASEGSQPPPLRRRLPSLGALADGEL